MQFEHYARQRDQKIFFESVGMKKETVLDVSSALSKWVEATHGLLESLNTLPEARGHLIGSTLTAGPVTESPIEQEVALEVQRVRNFLHETNIEDVLSRLNQHTARLTAAADRLK